MMTRPEPINKPVNNQFQPALSDQERERLRKQHREWVSYIILHAVGGIVLGALVVASLVLLDINHIGTRVFSSSSPWLFVLLMVAGFGSTFGMAAAGTAIYFKSTEKKG